MKFNVEFFENYFIHLMKTNGSFENQDFTMKEKDSSCQASLSSKSSLSARARWQKVAKYAFAKSGYFKKSLNIMNHDPLIENEVLKKDLNLLQLLTLNSPANSILLRNRLKEWIQLSGHENSFEMVSPGTIWKKSLPDERELKAYQLLMKDIMRSFVPQYFGDIFFEGNRFIELEDLIFTFHKPSIMDIKMGTRTFLESEVNNDKLRSDLYAKMIKLNKYAATPQENEIKAVTKLRYMKFRESISSTSNLGFRIEGFKSKDDTVTKDLSFIREKEEVKATLSQFLSGCNRIKNCLIDKLKLLRDTFKISKFFQTHEVIGSSLLIIYDDTKVGVWMIDFAKTVPLFEDMQIDHYSKWVYGNHEDGYLFGIDNLIDILEKTEV